MFTQLNPPLPLHVLGKGAGHAIGVIDYGVEHHLVWVTAIVETGEIWCAPNPRVRMQSNWTMGRDTSPAVAREREQHQASAGRWVGFGAGCGAGALCRLRPGHAARSAPRLNASAQPEHRSN